MVSGVLVLGYGIILNFFGWGVSVASEVADSQKGMDAGTKRKKRAMKIGVAGLLIILLGYIWAIFFHS